MRKLKTYISWCKNEKKVYFFQFPVMRCEKENLKIEKKTQKKSLVSKIKITLAKNVFLQYVGRCGIMDVLFK